MGCECYEYSQVNAIEHAIEGVWFLVVVYGGGGMGDRDMKRSFFKDRFLGQTMNLLVLRNE